MLEIPDRIPIRVDPLFWLVVALISVINSQFSPLGTLIWGIVIVISVVVHEFGHALSAIYFGQRASIDLVGFGGLTRRYGPPLKSYKEFMIVLAGPAAGLTLCAICYYFASLLKSPQPLPDSLFGMEMSPLGLMYYAASAAWKINLFWTIFNLLPVQQLDGGQLLKIILEAVFGVRGIKIALFISLFVSTTASLVFFIAHHYLIGAFFLMFTYENYRIWKESLALTSQDIDTEIQHLLKDAESDYHKGQLDAALGKLRLVRKQAKEGVLYQTATEVMSYILAEQGRMQEAYALLLPFAQKARPESLKLLQLLAFRLGKWEEAISVGNTSYKLSPYYETALINARCYAILGEAQPSAGWLRCAIRDGLPNLKEVLSETEFNHVRDNPLFQQFQDSNH